MNINRGKCLYFKVVLNYSLGEAALLQIYIRQGSGSVIHTPALSPSLHFGREIPLFSSVELLTGYLY